MALQVTLDQEVLQQEKEKDANKTLGRFPLIFSVCLFVVVVVVVVYFFIFYYCLFACFQPP